MAVPSHHLAFFVLFYFIAASGHARVAVNVVDEDAKATILLPSQESELDATTVRDLSDDTNHKPIRSDGPKSTNPEQKTGLRRTVRSVVVAVPTSPPQRVNFLPPHRHFHHHRFSFTSGFHHRCHNRGPRFHHPRYRFGPPKTWFSVIDEIFPYGDKIAFPANENEGFVKGNPLRPVVSGQARQPYGGRKGWRMRHDIKGLFTDEDNEQASGFIQRLRQFLNYL